MDFLFQQMLAFITIKQHLMHHVSLQLGKSHKQHKNNTATTLSILVVVFQLNFLESRFLLGFLPVVHEQKLWQCGTSSLLVRCASCHRANSIKALQETQQHRPKPEYEVLRQGALFCYISSMKSRG